MRDLFIAISCLRSSSNLLNFCCKTVGLSIIVVSKIISLLYSSWKTVYFATIIKIPFSNTQCVEVQRWPHQGNWFSLSSPSTDCIVTVKAGCDAAQRKRGICTFMILHVPTAAFLLLKYKASNAFSEDRWPIWENKTGWILEKVFFFLIVILNVLGRTELYYMVQPISKEQENFVHVFTFICRDSTDAHYCSPNLNSRQNSNFPITQ